VEGAVQVYEIEGLVEGNFKTWTTSGKFKVPGAMWMALDMQQYERCWVYDLDDQVS